MEEKVMLLSLVEAGGVDVAEMIDKVLLLADPFPIPPQAKASEGSK
jgi:hypothetical protein